MGGCCSASSSGTVESVWHVPHPPSCVALTARRRRSPRRGRAGQTGSSCRCRWSARGTRSSQSSRRRRGPRGWWCPAGEDRGGCAGLGVSGLQDWCMAQQHAQTAVDHCSHQHSMPRLACRPACSLHRCRQAPPLPSPATPHLLGGVGGGGEHAARAAVVLGLGRQAEVALHDTAVGTSGQQ